MQSRRLPSLGGGGGNVNTGDGGRVFAFLKEELNGETVGGKAGTCTDKT